MHSPSIRSRLLLWLILPLSLLASAVSVEAYFSVRRTSDDLHDRTLQTVLLTLSEHMDANDNELVAENLLEVLTASLGDQFFYHFVAPDNAWVIGYSGVPPRPAGVEPVGGRIVFYDGVYQGDPVRAVVSRRLARVRDLDGWTTLTVWQRVRQRHSLALELFARSLWRLALLVGAAGLIAWWAVARGLRPVDDLREAVAKRSPDDLSPIQRRVPTELRPITRTMNALFARLAKAGQARERLIGDAAHQLRNPVAALRTQAQNVVAAGNSDDARERAGTLVDSTERLGRLVDQMLLSARSNSGTALADRIRRSGGACVQRRARTRRQGHRSAAGTVVRDGCGHAARLGACGSAARAVRESGRQRDPPQRTRCVDPRARCGCRCRYRCAGQRDRHRCRLRGART